MIPCESRGSEISDENARGEYLSWGKTRQYTHEETRQEKFLITFFGTWSRGLTSDNTNALPLSR